MRYLVTGAAGFIGSHLAESLTVLGHDVVGLDSFTDYYDPVRKRANAAGLDVLEADLLEAAARRGVRVVYASSSSVYGDAETYPTPEDVPPRPISPYGVTKLCVEHLAYAHARTTGLDAVGVRYFTVYGPRQRPDMAFTPMLEALAGGEPFRVFGDGSVSRSWTYVADAVAGT